MIDLCSGVGMSTRALEKVCGTVYPCNLSPTTNTKSTHSTFFNCCQNIQAFHDAEYIVGIDTSSEMINMAQGVSRHELELNRAFGKHLQGLSMLVSDGLKSLKAVFNEETNPCPSAGKCQASYRVSNAEKTSYPSGMFDLVTIMYGFHEVPEVGRARIIDEARRLLCPGGHLAILDICPTYAPSEHMLAGEPFVKEYQRNIDSQLFNSKGFRAKKRVVVAGHVNLWLLTKIESEVSP